MQHDSLNGEEKCVPYASCNKLLRFPIDCLSAQVLLCSFHSFFHSPGHFKLYFIHNYFKAHILSLKFNLKKNGNPRTFSQE